jgi:hypothetical protein
MRIEKKRFIQKKKKLFSNIKIHVYDQKNTIKFKTIKQNFIFTKKIKKK